MELGRKLPGKNSKYHAGLIVLFSLMILALLAVGCALSPEKEAATTVVIEAMAATDSPAPTSTSAPTSTATPTSPPASTPPPASEPATATASPTTPPTITPMPTPTPLPRLIGTAEELIGVWRAPLIFIQFDEDGSFRLADYAGETRATGEFWFEGTQLKFKDTSGLLACPASQIGGYEVRGNNAEDRLSFTEVEDACLDRSWALTGGPLNRESR